MLTFFNRKKNNKTTPKRQISITAILAGILRPGTPALFLYQGELIRTSAVQAILETAPDYVRFETQNSIYTIAFDTPPWEEAMTAA